MPALAGFAVAALIIGIIGARFHYDVVRLFEARDRLRAGGVLLDVDRTGDFVDRHPQLAVNIPLAELARRAHELGPIDKPIVIYAHRFRDGAEAAHLLRSMGFKDVFDAAGVRVKEKLSATAARVEAARIRRETGRGIPDDIELAPRPS